MTKQQANKAFAEMLKAFPKIFGRVSFRERLMLRTAFTKANCDLAIEGRDVKIMELEKENAELKTQNEWLEDCKSELAEFLGKANDRIAGLEQQIEKMKRCEICKHFRWNCCSYEIRISKDCLENGMKHFELKEIEK